MTELKNTYSGGWIKLHRSFVDWEWYSDINTKIVALHVLLKSNYEDKKWRGSTIARGQLVTSISSLSENLGITVKQIIRAIKNLEDCGFLVKQTTNKFTVLTVCNYGLYQNFDDENFSERANKGQTKDEQQGNQRATTKEIKNIKNIKRSTNVDPKREETEILDLVNTEDQDPPIAPTPPAKKETDEEKFLRGFIHYCPSLPKPKSLTKERKTKIKLRLTEMGSFDTLREVLEKMEASDFLTGREGNWKANIDWLITNDKNWIKIIEGNYDNKTNSNSENNGTKSKLQSTCRLGVSSDYSADESSL